MKSNDTVMYGDVGERFKLFAQNIGDGWEVSAIVNAEHRNDVVCQADEFTLLNIFLTFFDRYPKPDEDM
jgi:hypothetical protein